MLFTGPINLAIHFVSSKLSNKIFKIIVRGRESSNPLNPNMKFKQIKAINKKAGDNCMPFPVSDGKITFSTRTSAAKIMTMNTRAAEGPYLKSVSIMTGMEAITRPIYGI